MELSSSESKRVLVFKSNFYRLLPVEVIENVLQYLTLLYAQELFNEIRLKVEPFLSEWSRFTKDENSQFILSRNHGELIPITSYTWCNAFRSIQ